MYKTLRSSAATILLLLAGMVPLLLSTNGCRDTSGCITFGPQRPLAIGILNSTPGSNCDPDDALVEALEARATALWQTRMFPMVIVKEEAGFSPSSAKEALARLLARPNLAAVLLLDCQSGSDDSLQKMVRDAGVSAWLPAVPPASVDLLVEFDRRVDAIDEHSSKFFDRYRIGRSSLDE